MKCRDARVAIVLDQYGELDVDEKAQLEDHLHGCQACVAEQDETREVLAVVSPHEPDVVPDFDPERSWRAIRSGIGEGARPARVWLMPGWGWGLAAAGLTLVLGIMIGRIGSKPSQAPATAKHESTAAPPERGISSIKPVLATHLEDLQPILLDLANSAKSGTPGATVPVDEQLLRGLLLQNLLLRRALEGKDTAAAELLDDLDLVLKEIVNGKASGGASQAQVQELIRQRSILFRMQILKRI